MYILSELTGEDIWTKLQQMDLHEVLRRLEHQQRTAALVKKKPRRYR